MRFRAEHDGLSVHAIAGTEVVLFGLDLPSETAEKLLGFGFERIDEESGERRPLLGRKTFEETEPAGHDGGPVSTLEHPVQAFLWGDYAVEPGHEYTYRVVALGGTPKNLKRLAEVFIPVTTESPKLGKHAIYFNRGAAASQAYEDQFFNKRPNDVADRRAWKWLSRGLEEALLAFIDRAQPGDQLRAALYEFVYPPVLDAFGAARDRGVDVRIVMDAKKNDKNDPRKRNRSAVANANIGDLVIQRERNPSNIAHNKFIVHVRADQPVSVWTGSTNITEGGIFGHSNVGHAVRDANVAASYLAYWNRLEGDPERADLRLGNEHQVVLPSGRPPEGITPVFSPRGSLAALEWYAELMDGAETSVFLTAAFGISEQIEAVLSKNVDYLRYGLLEGEDEEIVLLKRDRNNVFAVGSRIENALGGWAVEALSGLNNRVMYIHNKFMLIDPLTADPIVITGSANFSDASSRYNDENMLVIRGSTRVADVYLTEFMRLFNHFEFRQHINATASLAGSRLMTEMETGPTAVATSEPKTKGPSHLKSVPGWALEHYHPGWRRTKERELFR